MTDSPGLDERAFALLELALDVPPADRTDLVIARAGDDAALRDRVLLLIRSGEDARRLRTGGAVDAEADQPMPDRIGHYRISGLIGRGGMGTVYRGERDTGDFDHVVAIKLIRPGAMWDTLVERFSRERQTLARLSHQHIARLFDGGETSAGEPYLVMEHIDGQRLDDWLSSNPSRADRIRLFLEVCAAVGFAHQNLIIHRDLTPANILVDRTGAAKIIDFGIAKPPADPGDRATDAEPGANLSVTPGYAAPERIAGRPATTLSDIFSLGMLLERMLGNPRDVDLAAIVARARQPVPEDRYPSADALADDIAAWRDGGVVAAREGGRRYVIGRFVSRHRTGIGASIAALALILASLAATSWSYARAERALRAETARFEQLRSLASYMVFDLDERLARVVGNAAARVSLVARGQSYLSALAASAGTRPDLQREAARGFIALARIQGVPTQPNFGDNNRARSNLHTAIAMLRPVAASTPAAAPDLAEGLAHLAMILAHVDANAKAAAAALVDADAVLGGVSADRRDMGWMAARSRLRKSQFELAVLGGDAAGISTAAERLETEIGDWPADARQSRAAATDRAFAMHFRGNAGYFSDDLVAGVAAFKRAETMFKALDVAEPNDPVILNTLAWNAYIGFGTASSTPALAADAAHFLRTAHDTVERLIRIEPNDRALRSFAGSIRGAEAQALSGAGRHAEAVAAQRSVIGYYRAAIGPDRKLTTLNRLVTAHVTMANIAMRAGDRDLGCASTATALAQLVELEDAGNLQGYIAKFKAGLADNKLRCATGRPLSILQS